MFHLIPALRKCLIALSLSVLVLLFTSAPHAQTNSSKLEGTVADAQGRMLVGASITLQDTEGNVVKRALTDAQGAYSFTNMTNGHYNLVVSASGFSTTQRAITVAGNEQKIEFKLALASISEEVVVESEDNSSLAVQSAPVKSLLDAGSARTEISSNYIAQYTSPVTDFADIIQAAPGTVSYTTNGIGNGQAKIYFRGFVDDDYTMTWDGVPFNDSNDPSHHSWAYIPAAAIGHVDFDRSPGTASDIGHLQLRRHHSLLLARAERRGPGARSKTPMAPGTPTRSWATSIPAPFCMAKPTSGSIPTTKAPTATRPSRPSRTWPPPPSSTTSSATVPT